MVNRLLHGSIMIQYHHKLMPFAWSVFIDLSILAAIYSHKSFALTLHVIGATLAGIITIATSFPSFIKGIPPVGDPMRLHKQIGTFLYMLIVSQIILGIMWYIMRSRSKGSQCSLILKKMHKTIGYSIASVAKFQVLYILGSDTLLFWFNLIWDIILLFAVVRKKRSATKSQSYPQLNLVNASYRTIHSLNQISFEYPNIFLYGNYVFNCEQMKNKHPGGYQVIIQSKDQCIDRYIYGMFGPENIASIKPHSHTSKSLAMLMNPIAKLDVPEQFTNLNKQSYQVKIHSVDSISSKSGLFHLRLIIQQNEAIEYKGYSEISQLGRYYSLTLNQKLTRLYSTVNFMLSENIIFLMKVLPHINKLGSYPKLQSQTQLVQMMVQQFDEKQVMIPLLIKKYNDGRFTKKLLHHEARRLTLSCSKGRGLQLANVQNGKIIIVSGGTGLLPFCDLIDLLFKRQLIKQEGEYKQEVLNKNSILRSSFLLNNTFTFIISVNYLCQIHPVILNQLQYLAEIPEVFQIHLRAKNFSEQIGKIKLQKLHFQALIEQKIRGEFVSKILVCGPCSLSQSIRSLCAKLNYKSYLIL